MEKNKIYKMDCWEGLELLEDGSVDMVLTDPPYSSGEAYASDRRSRTGEKYGDSEGFGIKTMPDFSGDNMDQRAFTVFMREIFAKCRVKTRPEGVIAVFIDWRNLPAMTDALQAAGWVWRGVAAWHKPNGRPQKGRYRQELEFIVWASNGPLPTDRGVGVLPGLYKYATIPTASRLHQTEKPLPLIEDLIELTPKGTLVLDPFIGAGTTAIACQNKGRDFIGFETSPEYFEIASKRIVDNILRESEDHED